MKLGCRFAAWTHTDTDMMAAVPIGPVFLRELVENRRINPLQTCTLSL